MMDRLTIEASELAFHPGYPDGLGVGAPRRARRRRRCRWRRTPSRSTASAAHAAPSRSAWRATTPSARCSGSVARVPFRPWGGSRPTTTSRTASSRARSCPRCCDGSRSSRASTGSASGTCSTQATGTCTRSCSTTRAVEGDVERAKELAEEILAACLDAGGALTGEHGIGVDKACSMPKMFSERDLEVFATGAPRLRPGRDRQPRQGASDAAPVRRGAGAVPDASAGEARACRALLAWGNPWFPHEPPPRACAADRACAPARASSRRRAREAASPPRSAENRVATS